MSSYRRGAVLGLTVAEAFILLAFLLLIALLGLSPADEPLPDSHPPNPPRVWVRPEEIERLVNSAEQARKAQEHAEQALADAERERDQAQDNAEHARMAEEAAAKARAAAERERDNAHQKTEQARKALEQAEQALAAAEHERRKGENPPCWYEVVPAGGEGKTREKPYYVFNVAIYENSIELAPRLPPPGGASDDDGIPYADEWQRLRIGELPYGRELSDDEFIAAVRDLVAQGRNSQVRTYECVFSVMVWDKTPEHAKKRWKDAHDRIIEGAFSAYTVQDLEWNGVE